MRGKIILAAGALAGALLFSFEPASAQAQACGGGPLSTSSGNLIGSALGAAAGGLLGNQIGHGSGKGVATGVGVVGGALAGGYAGRTVQCDNSGSSQPPAAAPGAYQPAASGPPRSCHYVATEAQLNGQQQQMTGVACLDPDGAWRLESNPGAERAAQADLVLRAQQQLRQQGFYVRDNVDGQWGPATSAAVRNYQRANGLDLTGQLDQPTQAALGIGAVPLQAAAVAPAPPQAPPAAESAPPPPPPAASAGATAIQAGGTQ